MERAPSECPTAGREQSGRLIAGNRLIYQRPQERTSGPASRWLVADAAYCGRPWTSSAAAKVKGAEPEGQKAARHGGDHPQAAKVPVGRLRIEAQISPQG